MTLGDITILDIGSHYLKHLAILFETFIHKLLLLFDKVLQKWKRHIHDYLRGEHDVIVDKRCRSLVYFLAHVLGNLGALYAYPDTKKGTYALSF